MGVPVMTFSLISNKTAEKANLVHGRKQWEIPVQRGVNIGDPSKVRIASEQLLPKVVIRGDAEINRLRDHLVIGPLGSVDTYLTVTFQPTTIVDTRCFHYD